MNNNNPYNNNPYAQYKNTQIQTATPGNLFFFYMREESSFVSWQR